MQLMAVPLYGGLPYGDQVYIIRVFLVASQYVTLSERS